MKKYILALSLLFVAACSSSPEPFEEQRVWIGRTKHELFQRWGLPHQTEPDGNGGEVLTYDVTQSKKEPANPSGKKYQHIRRFYVDSTGKIYKHDRDESTN